MRSRFRALGRALFVLVRAAFVLLLVVIPVPVGELFHRLTDKRRKAVAALVVKKENPD